jgi:hypothetical protein
MVQEVCEQEQIVTRMGSRYTYFFSSHFRVRLLASEEGSNCEEIQARWQIEDLERLELL